MSRPYWTLDRVFSIIPEKRVAEIFRKGKTGTIDQTPGSDDMVRIRSHLEAISKARADIQAARIANLFEAKKVLTDKQKNLIKEKFPRLGMILE